MSAIVTDKILVKPLTVGCRIELLCDGELILGTTTVERPRNHAEMAILLRGLIAMIEAPDVPDLELK